jgi:hypothetical protein
MVCSAADPSKEIRPMIIPLLPSDKLAIIAVRRDGVKVARYRQIGPYVYEVEYATNWQALEKEAIQTVEEQIGAIVEDADYPCPRDLAAQAVW